MSALRQPRDILTAEEYLQRDRSAEFRSEFVNGQVCAMPGGNIDHARIAGRVYTTLSAQIQSGHSEVFGSSLKVRIERANCFLYPDISGFSDSAIPYDSEKDACGNPSLIVEVLSPSTEVRDRGHKFDLYRLLESLVEYLLVRQDRMEVELFTRETTQEWSSVIYNEASDVVTLRSLNCTLTLEEIYERVDFSE